MCLSVYERPLYVAHLYSSSFNLEFIFIYGLADKEASVVTFFVTKGESSESKAIVYASGS